MPSKEEMVAKFDLWWAEEGEYLAPGTGDYTKMKNLALSAWLQASCIFTVQAIVHAK